ncbi:hypothetical protein D9758_015290 [Tetrapyrgos nigripes]|uniref:Uncharacterized protein n=1 Tax=Tetrapyrgos nigripes TaxID=182062 RepID=A0A8H5FQA6_9AGAR|nr:hypothetical protein D9758_015290 [Tetrapyrgos nigripes]
MRHNRTGISNIEEEIISKENDRFVIHDSQGYEPGDPTKFQELQRFIEQRSGEAKPSDKIHIICVVFFIGFALRLFMPEVEFLRQARNPC